MPETRPLWLKYDKYTECRLCPHQCKIAPGKRGICGVRENNGGKIELLTYGVVSALALDPVEKKPLYHFFPGYNILSVGSYGCNMRCDFCQNWQISQESRQKFVTNTTSEELAEKAFDASGNLGLAFTYNEPVIWFEFVRDTAVRIKEKGLYNVLVSNGFINSNPLKELLEFTDAFNIDLKAFSDKFYSKLTGAELEPVKESLRQIARSGRHLEITTLIVPGWNDSPEEMETQSKWIAEELGPSTPLHLSRYFPMYKRENPATPVATLESLFEAASRYLQYVYLGNTRGGSGNDTKCSVCGTTVTKRTGYSARPVSLEKDGSCKVCGNLIYRFLTPSFREDR
ncbi:MAG: AmmeMemoRadiSam system radical SAM enzyme [Bacteroidales bacterium]|jgi:pyruvate formate lyase activating enzyme|nr:AmmeMemoRadiSam system radical SAM enzyme [Bacteroidales bacterium]